MSKAKRYNKDKIDLSYIHKKTAEEVCKVWGFGAKKYGKDNWKKLWGDDTRKTVMASTLRHVLAINEGEDIDNESGLLHAAHAICNLTMMIEYYKQKECEGKVEDKNEPKILSISLEEDEFISKLPEGNIHRNFDDVWETERKQELNTLLHYLRDDKIEPSYTDCLNKYEHINICRNDSSINIDLKKRNLVRYYQSGSYTNTFEDFVKVAKLYKTNSLTHKVGKLIESEFMNE